MTLLAHKVQLYPTDEPADYCNRAGGSCRQAYNHLLAHFTQDGVKGSKKVATQYYLEQLRPAFPWYGEGSSRLTRNAIADLDTACKQFFRRVKAGQQPGFPRCKRQGKSSESFAGREKPKFDVTGHALRIERCPGRLRMRQERRFTGTLCQVTMSRKAGKYYASILIDTKDDDTKHSDRQPITVGVDRGVKKLAVLSTGKRFPANQKLTANIRRLQRRCRRLSNKPKGSNRAVKAKLSLARAHKRIADQRRAVLHALSDDLTRRYDTIVIENLNVQRMVRNRCLSCAISDAGLGTLVRQLRYKAKLRGCTIIKADRFFPSSKLCSTCGAYNGDLTLGDREGRGVECHTLHDLNASRNLRNYRLHTLTAVVKRTQESDKTGAQAPARLMTV